MKMLRHPLILLVLSTILLFSLLFLYSGGQEYNVLYAGGAVLLLSCVTYALITLCKWGDGYIFLIISMLVTIGVATLYRIDPTMGQQQIVKYVLGILIFFVAYFLFRYINVWNNLKWFYMGAIIALFVITLIFASEVKGAKNWINIFGVAIQPSEFIKLIFVMYLSSYFSQRPEKEFVIRNIREKYITLFMVYTCVFFLLLQREWGSMLIMIFTYLMMLYIFKSDFLLLGFNAVAISFVAVFGCKYMSHIQIRVANWIDPWTDISGRGYQITQSLFAIASGSFFGSGLGLGHPEYIPEVHSDFIFSAICEEMGIFGGIAVILLYFIIVYRGLKIALKLDGFDRCLATGITIIFGFQTFVIIGGVIKMIPLTGITLPFISYGGSSLLISFASMGILQALSARGGSDV
ncbi:MAG: FtsW/RodA/SpoVE family cell cycle protein [Eubacteriales bacterium]|nr:FtsW/RodA/SpoVE family cell cycle protein [Eubacteriales bacterium]